MNVIFMGTPDFAVSHLDAIFKSDHVVKAVFTQLPKPLGRRMKIQPSPVALYADSKGIPVFTPTSLKGDDIFATISDIEADVIVVVAYGFIIPKRILACKKYGCINVHPSDLPKYRGPAPLQHAIINNESKTAVCIIQMDEGVDTGAILLKEEVEISITDNYYDLKKKASIVGTKLIVSALNTIAYLPKVDQCGECLKYASKLTKIDGLIDFNEDCISVYNKIRAMVEWPCAYFVYDDSTYKILKAFFNDINHSYEPGRVIDSNLQIACSRGTIFVQRIQKEGRREMDVGEFLNGNKIPIGAII